MTLLLPVALICKTSNIVIRRRNHIFCGSFCFAWEQRELGNCFDERQERSSEGELISVTINEGIKKFSDLGRHDNSSEDKSNYKVVRVGDIAYNSMRMWQGASGYSPFNGILSPAYTVLIPKPGVDASFFSYVFKRPDMIHTFQICSQGITSDTWNLKFPALAEIEISMPTITEQMKIAESFRSLDNLITLHQREDFEINYRIFSIDDTQKMATTWEQRELNSLCDKFTDGDWIEAKDQSDCGVRLIQTGNVGVASYIDKLQTAKWISEDTFERLHCEEIFAGDILISRLPEPAGRACIVPKSATKMITAVDCTIVRTKAECSNEFLVQYLSSQKYFNEVNACLAGGTRQRISRGNLSKFLVPIPKDFTEQCLIGQYFSGIDNLITLHQCEDFIGLKSLLKRIVTYTNRDLTDTWEQRKFCYLYRKVSEKNDLTYGKDDIISVANMYFKSDSYITDDEYLRTYNVFLLGDIAFEGNKSKNFKHGRFVENTIGNGIVSHVFDVFRPIMQRYDLLFWKYAINNERLMGEILVRSTKASTMMTNLVADDFLNEYFLVPKYDEQVAIGRLLNELDNLITLHQCKFPLKSETTLLDFNKQTFRFFANAWEQRKVGELLTERNTQAPKSQEYPLMAFVANYGIVPKGERYDRSSLVTDKENKPYKKTEYGDFIYSSNNLETGSIGINKHGKASISPVYSIFEPTGIADSDFIGRRLVRKDFIQEMVKWRQGVIYGQWRIHESDFMKIDIAVPSIDEQRKIGLLLDYLDNLITLHQREEFGDFKRNFSFSSNYFAAFQTTTWEQRKLSKCLEVSDEKNTENIYGIEDVLSVSGDYGVVNQIEFQGRSFAGASVANYGVVHTGNVVYTKSPLKSNPYGIIKTNKGKTGIVSVLYGVYRVTGDICPELIQTYFEQDARLNNYLRPLVNKGAKNTLLISDDDALQGVVVLPPSYAEQLKMKQLFDSIDNLITLHQRDILYKKGVLQWQNKLKKQNFSANILNAGLKCIRKEPCARSP